MLFRIYIPLCSTSRPINKRFTYLQRNVCTSSQARAFRAKNSINSYLSRRHSGTVLTTKDVNLFAFIKRRGRVAFQRMRHESDPFDTLKRFMLAHQLNCTRTIATLWIAVKLIMDTTVITIITAIYKGDVIPRLIPLLLYSDSFSHFFTFWEQLRKILKYLSKLWCRKNRLIFFLLSKK